MCLQRGSWGGNDAQRGAEGSGFGASEGFSEHVCGVGIARDEQEVSGAVGLLLAHVVVSNVNVLQFGREGALLDHCERPHVHSHGNRRRGKIKSVCEHVGQPNSLAARCSSRNVFGSLGGGGNCVLLIVAPAHGAPCSHNSKTCY